jgi:hypothetical protein
LLTWLWDQARAQKLTQALAQLHVIEAWPQLQVPRLSQPPAVLRALVQLQALSQPVRLPQLQAQALTQLWDQALVHLQSLALAQLRVQTWLPAVPLQALA